MKDNYTYTCSQQYYKSFLFFYSLRGDDALFVIDFGSSSISYSYICNLFEAGSTAKYFYTQLDVPPPCDGACFAQPGQGHFHL